MPKNPASAKKGATQATRSRSGAVAKSRTGTAAANSTDRPVTKSDNRSKRHTKKEIILGLLRRKSGASIAEMAKATGWQAHSVRGLLSGTVKKKLGLKLVDEKPEGGARRYFVRAAS